MNKDKAQQPSELAQILALVQELKTDVSELKTDVSELKQRMLQLEEKVEARFQDTRPIWERVVGEIDKLRLGQDELRAGQSEIREELAAFRAETNHNLKLIEKKFKHVFGDIGELHGQVDMLEERLDKIAPQA